MTTDPKHVTHAQLFKAIAHQLMALGLTPEQSAAYVLSEETSGVLRPNAPHWIRQSALFRISRGECPSLNRLNDLNRIMLALDNLDELREDAFLVDGY